MVTLDGTCHRAVTSVGVRPTIGDDQHTIETYILEGQHDLYGRRMRLEFVKWLRPELKFDSLEALTAQIAVDCREARALFDRLPL
jgi:riboflavin kinase/FMN adenylyltransferase